jgi:glycosyltransferase involved in cell wall biosynthesis
VHVLLIHQAFVTQDEAGGTRHYELARHLVSKGHRVTVIASPVSYLSGRADAPKPRRETVDGIEVRRAWGYATTGRSFLARVLFFASFTLSSFWAALRVPRVDVVWGTSPPLFQAAGAYVVARLRRRRFCLEVRDLWPAFAVETGVLRNKALIWAAEWVERRLYQGADRIIVNSPGFVQHLRERGAKPQEITLVSNGVDASTFPEGVSGAAVRREWGLGEDDFVAMYTGAHGVANDLGVLLDAAALLRGNPRVRVVLVGDGREKAGLMAKAKTMGLTNVVFAPPQPKSRMPEVLAAADVCVATLQSVPMFRTVYPNKVFDYMAARKPTVLAIDGVIRQVIEEAHGGVFVAPGDAGALAQAIQKYADDPGLCVRQGRNARAHVVAHFDRTRQAEELERVFAGLTS